MQKDFLSKLNKRDYNNILEEILEKKDFSANVKNLLLNMFYKIETSYNDYSKVKVETATKSQFIEELLYTIENYCSKIRLVRPKSEESKILEEINLDALVNEKEKSIVAYPTEKALLIGLIYLQEKFFVITDDYTLIKKPFSDILFLGNELSMKEVIYDFDGWSWNSNLESKKEILYNLIYENLQILLGYEFIDEWKKNDRINKDYIKKMKDRLYNLYGDELSKKIYIQIYKILLIILVQNYQEEAEKLLLQKSKLEDKLKYLENKSNYLEDIFKKKREVAEKIKQLDEIVTNKEKLIEEYKKKNNNMPLEKKVFSINHMKDFVIEEREKLLYEIRRYNKMLEPQYYIDHKDEIVNKIKKYQLLNIEELKKQDLIEELEKLQKLFLECIEYKIVNIETKKEALEMIYILRYYKYIKLDKDIYIKQLKSLKNSLKNVERILIAKAEQFNIFIKFSNKSLENIEIILDILDTKIIDLECIEVLAKVENKRINIEVYDGEIIDNTLILPENIREIELKPNKKMKLFT